MQVPSAEEFQVSWLRVEFLILTSYLLQTVVVKSRPCCTGCTPGWLSLLLLKAASKASPKWNFVVTTADTMAPSLSEPRSIAPGKALFVGHSPKDILETCLIWLAYPVKECSRSRGPYVDTHEIGVVWLNHWALCVHCIPHSMSIRAPRPPASVIVHPVQTTAAIVLWQHILLSGESQVFKRTCRKYNTESAKC